MTLHRSTEGTGPVRPEAVGEPAGIHEQRREARVGHLATATLACPACDAPVAAADGPMAPADPIGCPVCGRFGAVRDFLSLAAPVRPAVVDVRVVMRAPLGRRALSRRSG